MIFFGELAVTVRVHTGSNSNMQARRRLGGQEEAQQEESRKSRSQRRSLFTLSCSFDMNRLTSDWSCGAVLLHGSHLMVCWDGA